MSELAHAFVGRRRIAAAAVFALLVGIVSAAGAQHPAPTAGSVPDVPAGSARIVGSIRHADDPSKAGGASVILYALSQDGSPGLRTIEADATGGFVFDAISNAPGIVYMIGVRVAGIPYGERLLFTAGQDEATIVIEVSDPTLDGSGFSVGESILRIEWVGSNLVVEETHQVVNPLDRVYHVPPDARSHQRAAFRTRLLPGATSFDAASSGLSEGYELMGEELRFWGPVFPGPQELRFRYLMPVPEDEGPLAWQLEQGAANAVLLFPGEGPRLSGPGLEAGPQVDQAGRRFESLAAGPVEAGDRVSFRIEIPETKNDPSAISASRVDVWVEVDDTFQQVSFEYHFDIVEGAYLAGDLQDPLLRFSLPAGAELLGLSDNAQSLGVIRGESGGMDLVGPLSSGTSRFSYRYRVPVPRGSSRLEIDAPVRIDQLNVLVADTGVVIDTDRLHRRRPFKSGTRIFLHREAFQVQPGERIAVGLTPIGPKGIGRRGTLLATTSLAALGIWFVFAPLSGAGRRQPGHVAQSSARGEREMVYDSLRDLELDFDTGKIDAAERDIMREELRARALVLLQAERDSATLQQSTTSEPAKREASESAGTSQACPSCGVASDAGWRFCVQCGEPLAGEDASA